MRQLYTARFLLPIASPAVEDGALLVEAGRVLAVGKRHELAAAHPGVAAIDFGDAVLLPSMVNAHTHLELSLFPEWCAAWQDKPVETDFVGWIRHLIRIKKSLPREAYPASVKAGIRACLSSGIGAVGDNLSIYAARSAYHAAPLLGRVFFELLGHEPALCQQQLLDIEKIFAEGQLGELTCGLAPHSPYTLSQHVLTAILGYCRQHDLPISMHLAESAEEVEFLTSAAGAIADRLYPYVGWKDLVPSASKQRPVPYLLAAAPLPKPTLLVHGVHVNSEETSQLRSTGATVVLCPRSNARLGVGRAPIEDYLAAGVPLALGTDSLASAESLSIWDELAFCQEWFAGVMAPEAWLEMATLGGARALGLIDRIGCLKPGLAANFQVVDLPEGAQMRNLCKTLCQAGRSVKVRTHHLGGRNVLPTDGEVPIMTSPQDR